eukprot:73091-Chlamydomonas_euryale.AAC.1
MELAAELKRIGDGLKRCMPAPPLRAPPPCGPPEEDAALAASCSFRIQVRKRAVGFRIQVWKRAVGFRIQVWKRAFGAPPQG